MSAVRIALALSIALGACSPAPEGPAPISGKTGALVRVVPGNTAAAEFLAAILGESGAARVAALPEQVDAYSSLDFRSGAWAAIPRFSRYEPEPLIAVHPDLVVTHEWQGLDTTQVLRAQGIPVVMLASARSYEDIRRSIETLGKALGAEEEASRAAALLDARAAKLRESAEPRRGLHVLEYSNNGTGGWTAGSNTTADAMIRLAGMRNAAAEVGLEGHPGLDLERLLAIDPDVIVVAAPARDDVGSPTKRILESTHELSTLSAVRKGRIVVLPASLVSTDSPCLVDAAERLAAEVDALLAAPADLPR